MSAQKKLCNKTKTDKDSNGGGLRYKICGVCFS